VIAGWAWDARRPGRRITVELLDGETPIATAVADRYRPDLEAAGIGDGAHSFSLPTPWPLKDGEPHVVSARITGGAFTLEGGPRRIVCQPEPDDLLVGSRSVAPVSRRWGLERGTPLDRHYIERFLSRHRRDIRGRVLEIGDARYTRRFGADRVTRSDVLNALEGNPATTILADLADGRDIPSDTFDAAIVTQTLQYVYDARAAIRTLHRILRPGGVILVTVPGITPLGDVEWGDRWYWSFTDRSIRLLFEEAFGGEVLTVESHGNVLAAASFLYGLTAEDLTSEELEVHDPAYPVTIAVRAVKAGTEGAARGTTGASVATRPAVLLYHRVADLAADPWGLSVHPDRFLEQLDALCEAATIVPLSVLEPETPDAGKRPTVALTFDDGYRDALGALEALRRRDLPATCFIVSGNLGLEPWWDELERLLLRPGVLVPHPRLWIEGLSHSWTLGDAAAYTEDDHHRNLAWRVADGHDPTPRHTVFRSVHAGLQPLPDDERAEAMAQVRDWVGSRAPEPTARTVSAEELRALAADPRIEIGAHSVTHPVLPSIPAADRRTEIRGSKQHLEELLGRPVRLFSYPFGVIDDDTVSMVGDAGFERAWTAAGAPIGRDAHPLRMARFTVGDWSGDELVRRLSDWVAP
jgi:peptidoglycan/xylan/chitin deacetylase (PgdA/CDA1 family)/SAM-dependent methyltransferase